MLLQRLGLLAGVGLPGRQAHDGHAEAGVVVQFARRHAQGLGHGGLAQHTRASLCARTRSQPSTPSRSSAMGAASQAVRSSVPIRSNDSGKPSSSPHDTTRGSMRSRHCGATHRRAGAGGSARPFVQVADPEIGPVAGDVEGQHARGMGAVDQHGGADAVTGGGHRRYGEPAGRGRGDLVHDDEAGALRAVRGEDVGDLLVGAVDGDLGHHPGGAGAGAQPVEGGGHGAVGVVGRDDLGARLESQATGRWPRRRH